MWSQCTAVPDRQTDRGRTSITAIARRFVLRTHRALKQPIVYSFWSPFLGGTTPTFYGTLLARITFYRLAKFGDVYCRLPCAKPGNEVECRIYRRSVTVFEWEKRRTGTLCRRWRSCALGARSFNAARGSGECCKLPQRVRTEPGRQTTFGAFLSENAYLARPSLAKTCLVKFYHETGRLERTGTAFWCVPVPFEHWSVKTLV